MRGQREGWMEFSCATEIRAGADPAGCVTPSLWVIAESFTEIPVALDFVQASAMCSGITEPSLKGKKKEGPLLGMAYSTFGSHPRQLSLIKSVFPSSEKPAV